MSQQQQTVLRVQHNNGISNLEFVNLDLYSSIPIKIIKSYAELQDIAKKNSDMSFGLQLPGSKKNNRFFESFFNVDIITLFFNATLKAKCSVLINDETFFRGYLRLNKVSVINSKVEYDVSLYNEVGNLFGDIGTKLLKDLNYDDEDYTFNHVFSQSTVTNGFGETNFNIDGVQPYPYFYPIVHNGYLYSGQTVNFTGGTPDNRTGLYTSTQPVGAFASQAAFFSAGGKPYRINTPQQGIYDNQLKPALSMWNLIKLMFKTYGYTIKSDFFNTPWMKSLYMYGYFSSPETKFSYTLQTIQTLPLEGVQIFFATNGYDVSPVVVTLDTHTPCYCSSDIYVNINYYDFTHDEYYQITDALIAAGTSGNTYNITPYYFIGGEINTPPVTEAYSLRYFPRPLNESITFQDGDPLNFSLVIDPVIKQIDVLSSLAKKFNLLFVPDPDVPNQIIIEPFSHYVGTGDIYDWTDKLSFDTGFTVEPALNYIESTLILTDSDDSDYGNKIFKERQNRIYGSMLQTNPTDFKSQEKKIETIFSPELIRQWDTADQPNNGGIKLPLGINYAGSSNSSANGDTEQINWNYTGVKTKPKLFFSLGKNNLFLDTLGEVFDNTKIYRSTGAWVSKSDGTFPYPIVAGFQTAPVISHTMPLGLADKFKINNDTLSILFNSEIATNVEVNTFNAYTENDSYQVFYSNRVNNLYNSSTRFISANFYLKLNEYKNLKANDLIKIQDQYFLWNKIDGYNLTDTELTKVELVQINNSPSVYPTRYFSYQYCDNTGVTFTLKTDFTNQNILYTYYGFSLLYDFNCGTLYGANTQPSGFTSSVVYLDSNTYFVPYTMYEITKEEYDVSQYDITGDTLMNNIFATPNGPFDQLMPTFWYNQLFLNDGLNLFTNCSQFASTASSYNIRVGNSQHFGPPIPKFRLLNTELTQIINTQDNNNVQIQ